MRIAIAFSLLVAAVGSAAAGDFQLSTVVVPNVGEQPDALAAVENAVKDEAGVLPLRIEGTRALADIVAQACPGATDNYLRTFADDVAALNPDLFKNADVSLSSSVGTSGYEITTLYIPYCLGALSDKYVVKPGDNLWRIYEQKRQENGLTDWQTFLSETMRLNGAEIEKEPLAEGTVISVPSQTWKIPVATHNAQDLVDKLNAVEPLNGMIMERPAEWGKANDEGSMAGDSCSTVSELAALNGAEHRLWDVAETLMLNDNLDETYSFRRDKDIVRVAVLDSGVAAPGHPTMRRLIFPLTSNPPDRLAYPEDPRGFHGTGVLFTATGGYFLSTLNPLGIAVEAAPYNLYTPICTQPQSCAFRAAPERLRTAMDAAFDRNSNISAVNISTSFVGDDPLPWFTNYLGTDKDVLVVTSAGNDGQPIGDANKVYPAIYGGDESSNLITVGGVDLDGKLSPGSNYSPEAVDIAAWGCNVPVAEFDRTTGDFRRKLRSGTSYAAPQVLFAAAMILRERPRNRRSLSPSQVKMRLMSSADHLPALWTKVRHGRVLNFAKALSLYSDVVELKDTGALLRGKVSFGSGDQTFVRICGNQTVARKELLSITDLGSPPAAGTQRILIYRQGASVGGHLETRWCNAFTADVTLTDSLTNETRSIPTSNIASIVLATYPQNAE